MSQAPDPAGVSTTRRGMRWALVASLAVNLAFGGMMLGAFLHGGPGGRDMARDMGFGPYDAALRPQDRDALKTLLRAKVGDLKVTRAEVLGDVRQIIAALRAEPFDPAALSTAIASQQAHLTSRMTLGNQTMGDFLAGLSSKDRLDFADRLEHHLMHGPDDGPDGVKN